VTTRAAGPTRRAFLLGVTALIGFARRIRAQVADYTRYQPLVRPAQVPLEDLATPAKAFPFMADGMTLPTAAEPNQPVRFNGMIVRTSAGDNNADRFKAVCLKCPHEGCDVDFIADPARIPSEVTDALGHLSEALYICPCHNSTFKIDDGSKLFGPAPRGLYRFKVTAVNGTAVEVGEIEEDALLFA
jgi:Rieske Fe-S protein